MGKVNYEWDIEKLDEESRDVLDHNHADFLRELPSFNKLHLNTEVPVLVKDIWEDDGELTVRAHWYPLESDVPLFSDGTFVPKRFLKEFRDWRKETP